MSKEFDDLSGEARNAIIDATLGVDVPNLSESAKDEIREWVEPTARDIDEADIEAVVRGRLRGCGCVDLSVGGGGDMIENRTGKPHSYWVDRVPERFRKGEGARIANTVGELKAMLDQLPDDLPIRSTFCDGTTVVVFNVIENHLDPHLQFMDGDYE